jgi:hypothetical protein
MFVVADHHVELDMLWQGTNYMRDSQWGVFASIDYDCQCFVCKKDDSVEHMSCGAHDKTYKGVTKLWEECVCPKEEMEDWHKLDCPMGECVECGVQKSCVCLHEYFEDDSWKVSWRCFE